MNVIFKLNPGIERINIQTALTVDHKIGDHDAVIALAQQKIAKFGRNTEPPLIIKGMFKAAAKHGFLYSTAPPGRLLSRFIPLSAIYNFLDTYCQLKRIEIAGLFA